MTKSTCTIHNRTYGKVCPACAEDRRTKPHVVKLARPGTHVARDGKPYTITYEAPNGNDS